MRNGEMLLILSALGNRINLKVMEVLAKHAATTLKISELTEFSPREVTTALDRLMQAGLVDYRADQCIYRASPKFRQTAEHLTELASPEPVKQKWASKPQERFFKARIDDQDHISVSPIPADVSLALDGLFLDELDEVPDASRLAEAPL